MSPDIYCLGFFYAIHFTTIMLWNEKIDLIKNNFSNTEFSTPTVKRKAILKKIETHFIRRPKAYYCLNNFNRPFNNWWEHLKSSETIISGNDFKTYLESSLEPESLYWIACEFSDQILVYKSKLEPILDLIASGQTWTKTFHIIELKYVQMISLKVEKENLRIKHTNQAS
ncbi:MAG: hypothetical protein GQ574_05265 [Crocinitomix sp.]|nr:hypothetical protein [Crocinitomix sp.]